MKERENQLKASAENVKNYFIVMPKKKKLLIGGIALVVILLAVLLTVMLNRKAPTNVGYEIIYTATTPEAAADIYLELKGMGAEPIKEGNNVLVKSEDYDVWMLKMASQKDAPKDALAYGIFGQYASLTSTESDRKQALIYQLQDRLQETLGRIDGVRDAVVNLTIPEKSNNVWDLSQDTSKPSANVTMTMYTGVTLLPEQVTAVKNLVASSVLNLSPSDVYVIDASTGLGVNGTPDGDEDGVLTGYNKLEFQEEVERHKEEKAVEILEPIIGAGGVTARANVVLDFDKMIRESYELQGKNANNDGFMTGRENSYTVSGEVGAGGLVGEDPNTDIPEYNYGDPTQQGGVTSATNSAQYAYGYIKTQVENGQAAISSQSISVVVDKELNAIDLQTYLSLVSNSTGIPQEFIIVASKNATPVFIPPITETPDPDQKEPVAIQVPIWVWIVIAAVLLVVVILVIVLLRIRKKNKKIVEQKDAEIVDSMQSMEDEIAKYKRELEEAARAATDPKDDAIMDEVRGFAKENPEITANLLRSWLKEAEE